LDIANILIPENVHYLYCNMYFLQQA